MPKRQRKTIKLQTDYHFPPSQERKYAEEGWEVVTRRRGYVRLERDAVAKKPAAKKTAKKAKKK